MRGDACFFAEEQQGGQSDAGRRPIVLVMDEAGLVEEGLRIEKRVARLVSAVVFSNCPPHRIGGEVVNGQVRDDGAGTIILGKELRLADLPDANTRNAFGVAVAANALLALNDEGVRMCVTSPGHVLKDAAQIDCLTSDGRVRGIVDAFYKPAGSDVVGAPAELLVGQIFTDSDQDDAAIRVGKTHRGVRNLLCELALVVAPALDL
jgi:hypothetical protein